MIVSSFSSLLGYMLICSFTLGHDNILALNITSIYEWKRNRLFC